MARWKLTEPHYLNIPGTKWELTLTDRATGRPKRMTYQVPLYLHPDTPTDWNYHDKRQDDGEIIVCHVDKGLPDDIVFIGEPTPGMLPLDDEAKAISGKFKDSWVPNSGLDDVSQANGFSQKLLLGLLDKMSDAQTAAASVPMAPGFEKLMETMALMMTQQTQILAAMSGKLSDAEFVKAGKALGEEPVIDDAEPLPDAEPTAAEIAEAARLAKAAEKASADRAQKHALSGRR